MFEYEPTKPLPVKNAHIYLFLLLVIFTISCKGLFSQTPESFQKTKADKIDELVGLYAAYGGFNGTVLVAHEGNVIYKKGFGHANMEWEIPNQTNTKFQIASVTKQFTAMLIIQLVAEKKLDLQTPIATYLPDYPKTAGNQITIHQLLTHSAGIPNAKGKEKAFRPKDQVEQFANEPLEFTPGQRFSYSNSGYTLLGYLIETVTGKPYETVLKERICTPLGMENTGLYRHRPILKNMSSGYNKWYGDYFDVDHSDASSAYAAGGIYTTVEDLFIWNQALENTTLIPLKYMNLIFTKHIEDLDYNCHYGYGWELKQHNIGNTNKTIETIGHGGSIDGYRASLQRVPSNNSCIILLNNTSYAFLNAINKAILGILHDESYDFPKKPLAQFMVEVIKKEDLQKGIAFYKKHKDSADYYISEEELIVAGYRFLHAGNPKDAAEIFKLSIDVFPDRYNPYDSYAEALMALGQNEKAILFYKKSLQLNPNNHNAKNMLKKLEQQ